MCPSDVMSLLDGDHLFLESTIHSHGYIHCRLLRRGGSVVWMIDKYVRYPLHTPLIDISMVLGMHEKLRMTCHGYGRIDKVTHEMQPRFINSSTLSPTPRESCLL